MDTIAEYIASYGASIGYEDLPPEVIHKVKCLLIDSLACALGGYDSEPSRIARRIAGRVYKCDMPATIIGSGEKSSPELATFANGTMIRYLDFNDGFCGKSAGHPSDNFGPVLTCADAVGAGGREVIVASVLAYEVFCRLSDRFDLKGFDQAVTGVISCVMGASKIFSLSFKQMVEAVNLAITPNISLLQTRLGELSMWKGCALANAARNAVFASFLAKEGMTGPSPVFEGRAGFIKVISGPFQLEEFGGKGSPFRIMDVLIKRYPCGMFAQTAIDAAIKLRLKIPSLNEIAAVNIGTFELGKTVMAGDDEKWHPKTRESADHSIPYVVGVALKYGTVEVKHFTDEYLENVDLFNLMKKIRVEKTEECDELFPAASANRVEVVTTSGERFSEIVEYHRGHFKNALTNEEIEEKFYMLSRDLLSPIRTRELLSLLWNLEQVDDISKIMQLLII
ncbi:MmgE/PrpD family protein [Thermodesulfobacteriota bacterium]